MLCLEDTTLNHEVGRVAELTARSLSSAANSDCSGDFTGPTWAYTCAVLVLTAHIIQGPVNKLTGPLFV